MASTANNNINNTIGISSSGVTNTMTVTNPSNTASSQASTNVTVGGTTSASSWVQWTIGSTESWALGQNNSDNQKLYLNYAASASINPTTGTTMFRFDHNSPGMVLGAGQSIIYNTTASAVGSLAVNGYSQYEIGTFTPTLIGATTAGTTAYSTQAGQYVLYGGKVNVNFQIVITSMTGTGDAQLTSLPFTVKNDSSARMGTARLSATGWSFSGARTMVVWQCNNNATTGVLSASGDGLTSSNVASTNAAATFNGTITYSI